MELFVEFPFCFGYFCGYKITILIFHHLIDIGTRTLNSSTCQIQRVFTQVNISSNFNQNIGQAVISIKEALAFNSIV